MHFLEPLFLLLKEGKIKTILMKKTLTTLSTNIIPNVQVNSPCVIRLSFSLLYWKSLIITFQSRQNLSNFFFCLIDWWTDGLMDSLLYLHPSSSLTLFTNDLLFRVWIVTILKLVGPNIFTIFWKKKINYFTAI